MGVVLHHYHRLAIVLGVFVFAGIATAEYVHDDPSGYNHPGCIESAPDWVDRVPSANRTCPGKPMTEVWDFNTEIQPHNKKLANDHFDRFFNTTHNLVPANDYNTPTYHDFVEPWNPPQIKGYSRPGHKRWRYQFAWQSGVQQQSTWRQGSFLKGERGWYAEMGGWRVPHAQQTHLFSHFTLHVSLFSFLFLF